MEPRLVKPGPVLSPTALLAAGIFALAAWGLWQAYKPAPLGNPIATSLLAFEKQDRLTVFSAQLAPVVSSDDVRGFGMLKSRQIAVIPARVDYTIDLSGMDAKRMRWDEQAHRLDVTLPLLKLSKPNLDEAHAQYLREGVWIGREAQDKLTRDNTMLAEQQAAQQAQNPALLDLAKGAAKDAVRQNLEIPLRVAGYKDVSVTVHFDGEPIPSR